MNPFEIEVLLTLALGTGVFFLISFLENLFRPRLSPSLRKFLWLFFILKMAVPLGIVSPLVFSMHSSVSPVTMKMQAPLEETPTVPLSLMTQAPLSSHTTEPSDTRTLLFTLYLMGLGLFSGLSLFNRFKMARYLKKSQGPSKEVLELLHEAKVRNNVNSKVKLREVPGLNSPTLLGLFHPQILMPLGVTKLYTSQEISLMLDHELSHLKALDHWLLGLVNLVQMILWFHPGVWLGRNRFLLALEEACDQRVLATSQGNSRQFYGLTLLKVLSQGQGKLRMIPSMASPKRMVKDRLVLLTRKIRVSPLAVGLLCAIFLGACAVGVPLVKPEEKKVPELIVKTIPKMLWPVAKPGVVINPFGPSINPFSGQWYVHMGIDIAEVMGTPIFAAHEGIVVALDYDAGGYGNYLDIENTDGYSTRYGHLARFAPLTLGQKVSRGEVIGELGATGLTTGPHLHFEVRQGSQTLDPTPNLDIPTGVTFLKPEPLPEMASGRN